MREWGRVSRPIAAIECAVLDGLGEVGDGEVFDAFEICDRPGNFQDAIMGASGEALLLHGSFKQTLGIRTEFTVCANLPGCHLRIGIEVVAGFVEALTLPFARGHHTSANFR